MNKKLAIVPAVLLSSALLLTACSSGNPAANNNVNPSASSSSGQNGSSIPTTGGNSGYAARPTDLDNKYKPYYFAPTTVNDQAWAYYKSIGSTTYKEDPNVRSINADDWATLRSNSQNKEHFKDADKLLGELKSDVEQSALNVSAYLKQNPSANLDAIKGNNTLLVNRYSNAGAMAVEQDSKTGLYFVIFSFNDNKGAPYGILVPQKGKTPDFSQSAPSK